MNKYQTIQEYIKKNIQIGKFQTGSYLPSENEFCAQFNATRTTVRKALDELLKEGFIQKEHGKGSKVIERRKSLGLLTVKGFSGSTNYQVKTVVTLNSVIKNWSKLISFPLSTNELNSQSVFFQRVRYINDKPVVLENNWYALNELEVLDSNHFVEGSFFKTLSQNYLIEIKGSEQEIKAIKATNEIASNLQVDVGDPILQISIRFKTSKPSLNLYSLLYCNTTDFPIRNHYFL